MNEVAFESNQFAKNTNKISFDAKIQNIVQKHIYRQYVQMWWSFLLSYADY